MRTANLLGLAWIPLVWIVVNVVLALFGFCDMSTAALLILYQAGGAYLMLVTIWIFSDPTKDEGRMPMPCWYEHYVTMSYGNGKVLVLHREPWLASDVKLRSEWAYQADIIMTEDGKVLKNRYGRTT